MQARQYAQQLMGLLKTLYDEREAENIARYMLDELYGKELLRHNSELTPAQYNYLRSLEPRLVSAEPIQYILERSWFYGRPFFVDRHVLIPRPETEELVENIIRRNRLTSPTILDIGTGSGCIAITLQLEIPEAQVTAIDISPEALAIAKRNGGSHQPQVAFKQVDILSGDFEEIRGPWNLIVSNPPYVDPADAISLHPNVRNFEPHLALFGPQNDPLRFYLAIADFASEHLAPGGQLWLEIPENQDEPIRNFLQRSGLHSIEVINDLQGKRRMVTAVR